MLKAENNPQIKDIQRIIADEVKKLVPELLKTSAFTQRKLTDTPNDALEVVNRKFVTLNGASASRPLSSIVGQYYFDTTLGRPIWWDGASFVDADGNVI